EIGLNSPRMPSGALGFMSKESRWLGPPNWCRKMTDLTPALRLGAFSSARRRPGRESMPRPPTRSMARRLSGRDERPLKGCKVIAHSSAGESLRPVFHAQPRHALEVAEVAGNQDAAMF